MGLWNRIVWLAFRRAPVRFHVLRDAADPGRFDDDVQRDLHRWARSVCPPRRDRKDYVRLHRRAIEVRCASAGNRRRIIACDGDRFVIEAEPAGTVFVYNCALRWGRLGLRRTIELELAGIEAPGHSGSTSI